MLIGSINNFLTEKNMVRKNTPSQNRFEKLQPCLQIVAEGLTNLTTDEKEKYLSMKGQGADNHWFKLFQSILNKKVTDYEPADLIDWKERQDKSLQIKAKELADNVERKIKTIVINNLKNIFGNEWELEIPEIQAKCHELALKENAERKKNGIHKRAEWTEMLTIINYKTIIEKFWSRKASTPDAKAFSELFALDIGEGFNSKLEKTKWLLHLNDFRKTIAHSGSKREGLNNEEVDTLEKIHDLLAKNLD